MVASAGRLLDRRARGCNIRARPTRSQRRTALDSVRPPDQCAPCSPASSPHSPNAGAPGGGVTAPPEALHSGPRGRARHSTADSHTVPLTFPLASTRVWSVVVPCDACAMRLAARPTRQRDRRERSPEPSTFSTGDCWHRGGCSARRTHYHVVNPRRTPDTAHDDVLTSSSVDDVTLDSLARTSIRSPPMPARIAWEGPEN